MKDKIEEILGHNDVDCESDNTCYCERSERADKILKLVKEELISKLPMEKGLPSVRPEDRYILHKIDGFNQALKEVKEIIEKL
jgi:hypothetical protein